MRTRRDRPAVERALDHAQHARERVARAVEMVVADETENPETGISAIKKLTADEKRLFARQMEVYAGFMEFTDHHVGRLLDSIATVSDADLQRAHYGRRESG